MANALFSAYRNNILGHGTFANVQLDADTIKALFVDHGTDTPSATGDDAIDDILSGARVPSLASAQTLGSKTVDGSVAAGTFDSADPVFTALSGASVESLILVKDSGTESTSILIAFYDTFTSGMPLTPNGGDVTVQVNASGWFQV